MMQLTDDLKSGASIFTILQYFIYPRIDIPYLNFYQFYKKSNENEKKHTKTLF